jgi:hypothetical protein
VTDAVPADLNVRTRVHEYGGRAHLVAGETIFVQNDADQRLYRLDPGAGPRPITPEGYRYADMVMDGTRSRIVAVREDHTDPGREAVNTVVALDPDGPNAEGGRVLVEGSDFVSNPRLSPDCSTLAYLTWNHPDMPWDAAELWLARLDDAGGVGSRTKVGGGAGDSAFQPEWTPGGDLIFVAEETGWWNLYRWRAGEVEPLHPMEAEFGMPLWTFGASAYTVVDDTRLICTFKEDGTWSIGDLNLETLDFRPSRRRSPRSTGSRRPATSSASSLAARRSRPLSTGTTCATAPPSRSGRRTRSRSTRPTCRPPSTSSTRPATTRSPTASTTHRRTPTRTDRPASSRR